MAVAPDMEVAMDINKILRGVDCSCGKRHTCLIQKVYIERNAAERLTDLCKEYDEILIVADENTYGAAGDKATRALGDKRTRRVIFDGGKLLIPNEESIAVVRESLGDADLILGIGSGVIQDLCKYVAHLAKLPYMIFATAPSMDGYASDGAAMILGGMKETVKAGLPRAILADTEVMASAPMDMIRAGYGDIIGKYSALNDWRLSALVNGEYLCRYIYRVTEDMIARVLGLGESLQKRDEEAVRVLTEALIVVGIMMSFAGSSRPASGSEHHLSHFFEIVGIVKKQPYFSHGVDVAYSTVVTARLRERLVKSPFPTSLYREDGGVLENKLYEIYGPSAPSCIALQNRIGNYGCHRLHVYEEKENEIKEILKDMPRSEEIEGYLGSIGLDTSDFYSEYGEEKISKAILYAKDLKDRYTVLWLYYDLFGGCSLL